jgi:hypothetical protein
MRNGIYSAFLDASAAKYGHISQRIPDALAVKRFCTAISCKTARQRFIFDGASYWKGDDPWGNLSVRFRAHVESKGSLTRIFHPLNGSLSHFRDKKRRFTKESRECTAIVGKRLYRRHHRTLKERFLPSGATFERTRSKRATYGDQFGRHLCVTVGPTEWPSHRLPQ